MISTTSNLADEIRCLLIAGVIEVFDTMFNLEAKSAALLESPDSNEFVVAGSVGFIGDINGVVYIHVSATFARILASRMLGIPLDELDGDELVNDVVGELSNMVVGAVKSHLCDAGAPCVLTIPSVVRGRCLSIESVRCSDRRLLGFRCADQYIQVELLLKHSE